MVTLCPATSLRTTASGTWGELGEARAPPAPAARPPARPPPPRNRDHRPEARPTAAAVATHRPRPALISHTRDPLTRYLENQRARQLAKVDDEIADDLVEE